MSGVENNYTIQKGDNLWNVAKRQLQMQNGQKPTNAQIVQAMRGIAQANGCKNAEECRKKFFNKIGTTINLDVLNSKQQVSNQSTVQSTQVARQQVKITQQQIADINRLRELSYDSEDLTAAIDKNTNAETYEQYIRANKDFTSKGVDKIATGGTHEAFTDKDGKIVAEIGKDADGNIFLINLNIGNGGDLQMKFANNEVKTCIVSDKSTPITSNKNSIKEVLDEILKGEKDYTVQRETLVDGTICEEYSRNGIEFATVSKDPNTKDILGIYHTVSQNNLTKTTYFYRQAEGEPGGFNTSMQHHRLV